KGGRGRSLTAAQQRRGAGMRALLAHFLTADEALRYDDAAGVEHAAEAGLTLGDEGEAGRAVEQCDPAMAEIGQECRGAGQRRGVVDIEKGIADVILGSSMDDEGE